MNKNRFIDQVLPYSKIIYKVCHQYSQNQDDFNDLFQEIMFQLMRSFDQFKGDSKITTWIYRVAFNTALYQVRKDKQKIPTVHLNQHHFNISDFSNQTDQDQRDQLKELMNILTEIEKAIIILHLDEFSNEEIASIIGISKTNVSTKLNRIKNKMIQQFQKEKKNAND